MGVTMSDAKPIAFVVDDDVYVASSSPARCALQTTAWLYDKL
jgi:hypothetical protein